MNAVEVVVVGMGVRVLSGEGVLDAECGRLRRRTAGRRRGSAG